MLDKVQIYFVFPFPFLSDFFLLFTTYLYLLFKVQERVFFSLSLIAFFTFDLTNPWYSSFSLSNVVLPSLLFFLFTFVVHFHFSMTVFRFPNSANTCGEMDLFRPTD